MTWAANALLAWIDRVEQKAKRATMFELLELPASADTDAVVAAFHRIAAGAHPDLHRKTLPPEALERLVGAYGKVAAAYDTLRDPKTRDRYRKELNDRGRPVSQPPVIAGSQVVPVQRSVPASTVPVHGRTLGGTMAGFAAGPTVPRTTTSSSPPPTVSRTTTPPSTPPSPPPAIARTPTPTVARTPTGARTPTPAAVARTPTPAAVPRTTTPPSGRATPPSGSPAIPRTPTPPTVARTPTPPAISRTVTTGRPTPATGARVLTTPARAPTGGGPSGARVLTPSPPPRAPSVEGADERDEVTPPPATRPPARPPAAVTTVRPRGDSRPPGGIAARAQVYYRKAQSCLGQGDLGGALFNLRLAAAADPRSSVIRVALAEVESEIGSRK
jgi:hypothetical protein